MAALWALGRDQTPALWNCAYRARPRLIAAGGEIVTETPAWFTIAQAWAGVRAGGCGFAGSFGMNTISRSIAPSPQTDVAPTAALGSGLGPLGVAALIIAALYVGREVFVPIALAILLSFVLAPLIRLLQHIHVPRAIAGEMEPKGMNIWIEQAQGGEPAQRTTDAISTEEPAPNAGAS